MADVSASLLREVVDHTPVAVYLKDLEGRFLFVNREVERLFGLPLADLLGRTNRDVLGADTADPMDRNDRRVVEERRPIETEEVLGGSTYLTVKFPVYQGDGRLYGVAGVSTDITQRKRLELQAGILDAARMVDIFDQVGDGVVVLDRQWRYVYLNRRAAEMFGRTPEGLVGKDLRAEFPESRDQPFFEVYERALATQQVQVFEDYYEPWERWFENRVVPSPEGVVIFFTDVTRQRRLAVEWEDSRRLQERALAEDLRAEPLELLTSTQRRLDELARTLDRPEQHRELDALRAEVSEAVAGLRATVIALAPLALERSGLMTALREDLVALADESGLSLTVSGGLEREPAGDRGELIWRLCAQAVLAAARETRDDVLSLGVDADGGMLVVRLELFRRTSAPALDRLLSRLAGARADAERAGGSLEVGDVGGATVVTITVSR